MSKNRFSSRNLLSVFFISLLSIFITACGSSSDDIIQTPGAQGDPVFMSPYPGQYLGASRVSEYHTSELQMTVDRGGRATGELTLYPQVRSQTLATGIYPLSGLVDLSNGDFELDGQAGRLVPFFITGTLPTSTELGTYELTYGDTTYRGVIQRASQGTPTPPDEFPDYGDGQLIRGGTVPALNFTPDGSYNGKRPPVTTSSDIGGMVGHDEDGTEVLTIGLGEYVNVGPKLQNRSLLVVIAAPVGQSLVVGQTYPLFVAENSGGSSAVLTEVTTAGEFPFTPEIEKVWSQSAGTVGQATITSWTENDITVDYQFTNLAPTGTSAGLPNNQAAGSFDVSGTITGILVDLPF